MPRNWVVSEGCILDHKPGGHVILKVQLQDRDNGELLGFIRVWTPDGWRDGGEALHDRFKDVLTVGYPLSNQLLAEFLSD
jgi:hypothetical protein